jgi:putative SOS response-associated peptidase YedK
MCGRYALAATAEDILEFLSVIMIEDFPARYNIAPTQPILIVTAGEGTEPGSNLPDRKAMLVRWGFTPSWVKDPREFPLLINARSETAAEKASFRAAMRHRRILVPASGFYEWHRPAKDSGRKSQAYWIRPKNGGLVAFAGLMETWSSADGSEVDTGCILTVGANAAMAPIHDRMPVVIEPENFSRWLDCRNQEPRDVADLLKPADDGFFEMIAVSDKVNKVANMGPDLQEPVSPSDAGHAPPEKPKRKKSPDETSGGGGQMSLF